MKIDPVVRGLIEALGDSDAKVRRTIKDTLEQNYTGMNLGEDRDAWRAWFAKIDPEWGEPVAGVTARLRTIQPELGTQDRLWEAGQLWSDATPPVICLDVRNDGRRSYWLFGAKYDLELDVDGKKFRRALPIPDEWQSFIAGRQQNGLRVSLGPEWKGEAGPLHWTPGTHSVRISVKLHPPLSDPSRPIEVISNRVGIQILSANRVQQTVDSLKYEVGFVPDKTVALLGEEVMISFVVKNTCERSIWLPVGGDSRGIRPTRFQVSAVDSSGKPVRDPYPNPMNFGGLGGSFEIQPGLAHAEQVPISKWCAFEKPGVYTVTCRTTPNLSSTNTLARWGGLSKEPQNTVSTSFTLMLKEPSAADVQRVITTRRIEAQKERYQSNTGMSTLRAPVFLKPFVEKAHGGDMESIKAIGEIETPESTEALIGLAREKIKAGQLEIALGALCEAVRRLPNPRYYEEGRDGLTGKPNGKPNEWSEPDRQRVERTWRPQMAAPVREMAQGLVNSGDQKSLDLAGRILWYFGTPDDMPFALTGYTHAIEATQALPYKPQFYLQSSAAYVYTFAIAELMKRGGKVPTQPSTSGESAAFIVALGANKEFQPAAREQQIHRVIEAGVPFLDLLLLTRLNDPVSEEVAGKVPGYMKSKYKDVQKAAVEFAQRHPRAEYKQPLFDFLRSADESFMLTVANESAKANGIANIEMIDLWFGKLDAGNASGAVMSHLIEAVADGGRFGSARSLSLEELTAVKARWKRFIEENREKLIQGKRFKPGDPEFTPDLMPQGFSMNFGQTPWPPKS
ncbi:hypothetical protein LLG95_08985 [bacterium]|nr:hypothetical protein [bacterium]